MRFLHTADWQLGMTRHFLAGDAQPRYSAARRDAAPVWNPAVEFYRIERSTPQGQKRTSLIACNCYSCCF